MIQPRVIGIGNAVMDIIVPTTEARLAELGVEKGIMQLVDRDRSDALMAAQGKAGASAQMRAGGSVANTLAGIGRMGLSTAFIGRVSDDEIGRTYITQTEGEGTRFVNAAVQEGELPTSRSIILVTPDGERSMSTYLGISAELDESDVDTSIFATDCWLFLEGYLFDKPKGKAAFLKAAEACRMAGGLSGIALSDPFCVDRHRADFRKLVNGPMDYVIGNDSEWRSLYQTDDLEAALDEASRAARMVICTRSGKDAILIQDGKRSLAPVTSIDPVDVTGAGDQFAAGLIYGLASGRSLEIAARMAVLAATEVIGHVGPRAETDLSAVFKAQGLL